MVANLHLIFDERGESGLLLAVKPSLYKALADAFELAHKRKRVVFVMQPNAWMLQCDPRGHITGAHGRWPNDYADFCEELAADVTRLLNEEKNHETRRVL